VVIVWDFKYQDFGDPTIFESVLYKRYCVFPGNKERPGRDADLKPPSSAVVKKEWSYTSTPRMCRTACTEPQYLYNCALYLYLYLYSPYVSYGLYRASVPVQRCTLPYLYLYSLYVPYGLYRASVPVQRCTLPLPIPLLPVCAVRSVQSLSARTTVHFTFTYTSTPCMCRTVCTEPQCPYNGALYLYLYLYSPYVPYGLYRVSVPVQRCTLTLPVPLILLCAVRPVQNLSACTKVHFTFTYTSTPPMCRTACTEPQCPYNGSLYLYLYLYYPYVPYGLYRASVPVQRYTLPLPIPLLSLCAVQPVQWCTLFYFLQYFVDGCRLFSEMYFHTSVLLYTMK